MTYRVVQSTHFSYFCIQLIQLSENQYDLSFAFSETTEFRDL